MASFLLEVKWGALHLETWENPGNHNENVTKGFCVGPPSSLISESRFLCSACSSDPLPGLLLLWGAGGHGGVAVSGPSHPPPHTWAKPQLWLEGDAPARMTPAWADPLNLMMYTLGLQWHRRPTPALPPDPGTFSPSAKTASAFCPRWQIPASDWWQSLAAWLSVQH